VPFLPDIAADSPDPDDESLLPTPVVRLLAAGKAKSSRNIRDWSDDDNDDCLEIFNIPPLASRPPVRPAAAATAATKSSEQRKKRAATEPESSGPPPLASKRPKLRRKTPGDKSQSGPPEDTDG
jgi:hypothetical protein